MSHEPGVVHRAMSHLACIKHQTINTTSHTNEHSITNSLIKQSSIRPVMAHSALGLHVLLNTLAAWPTWSADWVWIEPRCLVMTVAVWSVAAFMAAGGTSDGRVPTRGPYAMSHDHEAQ